MSSSLNIKNPGLRALPPGVERYSVKGGGLSVIEISPEDKLEIINNEGKQTCEVIVFNSKGKSDLSILNLKENSGGNFSKKTISLDEKISKLFKRICKIRFMKILFHLNLYSGLKASILNQKWDPKGVPTIYNLIESLDKEFYELTIVLKTSDNSFSYIKIMSTNLTIIKRK